MAALGELAIIVAAIGVGAVLCLAGVQGLHWLEKQLGEEDDHGS